jgi:hypothetical protein
MLDPLEPNDVRGEAWIVKGMRSAAAIRPRRRGRQRTRRRSATRRATTGESVSGEAHGAGRLAIAKIASGPSVDHRAANHASTSKAEAQ